MHARNPGVPRRRAMLALALCALVPATGRSQDQPRVPRRIAWFAGENPGFVDDVRQALAALGYVEGRDFVLAIHTSREDRAANEAAARDVVAGKPDVILTGGTPNTSAVQRATSSIPIVMYAVADPVGAGFVRSIPRPGGNITGATNFGPELAAKQVELLRLVVPRATRFAVLVPEGPATGAFYTRIEEVVRGTGPSVVAMPVTTLDDVARALSKMRAERIDGLFVVSNTFAMTHRESIARLVNEARIPAIYGYGPQVEAGGLMSYGADPRNLHVVLAGYIDRILKGGKPADLPVQLPADFELAINVKTARALGVVFPREILARADKRVE